MDRSPPGSSVCGDSSGKNTGEGCHSLLQWIFPTQGLNPGLLIAGRFFTIWATREALYLGDKSYWITKSFSNLPRSFLLFLFVYFNWRLITLQYCGDFCHTLTWISHGCTCVPHPEPPSHLPPHAIPQGCPSAPALSALFHTLNLDWWSVSHMVIYMFQCYSLKSSPLPLPQSPKFCSLHLCLFCCLSYRVIITIFLNSLCMR